MEKNELAAEPLLSNVTKEKSRWYAGGLFTFLVTGEQTNGEFALIQNFIQKGSEPPPHTHTREDESVYVLEGEVEFIIGDKQFTASNNDFVFMPKNVKHSFKLETETARTLLQISPAGFENFFVEGSAPAEILGLPPAPQRPSPEQVQVLVQRAGLYGVKFEKP